MNNYTFGNYICQLREKKGLSQTELGKLLGVSNKAVSKWETGASYPSTEMMLPLAQALGTSIEELYNAVSQSKSAPTKLRRFLNTVFSYSKIWLAIFACIVLICYILNLFIGKSEDKVTLAIVSPAIAGILYGFLRILFFILGKNPICPSKFLDLIETLFMGCFVYMVLQALILFLTDLYYGYSPFFLAGLAGLTALTQIHQKRIK